MAIPEKDLDFYRYTKEHRFAKMYPLFAREIVEKFGMTEGVFLDVGTGSAAMAIEIAKITDMSILALDAEPEAIEMARDNCGMHGVPEGRIRFVLSPVEKMALPDGAADLVFSRGSIPFWKDLAAAFGEIQRVVAPGGKAMVGCGFSHYQSLEDVRNMRPQWTPDVLAERTRWKKGTLLVDSLREAAVESYEIVDDEYGTWVEISKKGDT